MLYFAIWILSSFVFCYGAYLNKTTIGLIQWPGNKIKELKLKRPQFLNPTSFVSSSTSQTLKLSLPSFNL
jgi:hypothetical protein